jgi:hypothetical protein
MGQNPPLIRVTGRGGIVAFNMQASRHFFAQPGIASPHKDLPRRSRNT